MIIHKIGIIENYAELKSKLQKKGVRFDSDTDTEVLANLIDSFLTTRTSMETALSKAIKLTTGAYTVAVMSNKHPGKIVFARTGYAGGIIVAKNGTSSVIASDIAAITNKIASKINENNTTTPTINPTKILVTFHLNPFVLYSTSRSNIAIGRQCNCPYHFVVRFLDCWISSFLFSLSFSLMF